MKPWRSMIGAGIVTALAVHLFLPGTSRLTAQAQNATTVNWPLHNLDLAGSRFSTMDQINRANVDVARAAMAVPARRHRRRQQPDDAGHCRRRDVRHRFARQCLRARRGGRPSALDLRRHQPARRRRPATATSSGNRGVVLRRRRRLHRGRLVPLRARRQDRQADPEIRQERPGQRHPRRAQGALSRT